MDPSAMEDASPEAFRARFREARRRKRIAVVVVTAMFVLCAWGLINIFIADFTRRIAFWTVVLLAPVAWFGWTAGRMLGDHFEIEVWKDFRVAQQMAGVTRKSLDQLMAEELGQEEMYRRQQKSDRDAASPPAG